MANFSPSPACKSNAVLQSGKPHVFWGRGQDGDTITIVSPLGSYSTQCFSGKWHATIEPLPIGGPYTIIFRSNDMERTIRDVHVGDVWLVAGQSNAFNHEQVSLPPGCAHYSGFGPTALGRYPEDFLALITLEKKRTWLREGSISTVGASFCRELNRIKDVPVGTILCGVSGSPIQLWYDSASAPQIRGGGPGFMKKIKPGQLAEEWVYPLIRMPVKGVLWWQGESNVPYAEHYKDHLVSLINEWRTMWKTQLQFLVIGLQEVDKFARADIDAFRASQSAAVEQVGNARIIRTSDITRTGDIHPPINELREIGVRAAAAAVSD